MEKFVEGVFQTYFESRGIVHQHTAPYVHKQNGKAEHYIHTIKDTAQSLIAWAGLPLSFLGDAILTAQYLQNCLSTSTLLALDTLYSIIEGKKPDLSYLRVWGCQCFVLYLGEIKAKRSPCCFKAIFIGIMNIG